MPAGKLTAKQEAFVREYLVDLNATQAYKRAGYKAKSDEAAKAAASRLLANVNVQTAVQAGQQARAKRTEITADSVLQELAKLGFANMADYIRIQRDGSAYVDLSTITREQAAAIQEITVEEYTEGGGEMARDVKRVKLKLADKRGSLDLLAKHLGIYAPEKRDVSGEITVNATRDAAAALAGRLLPELAAGGESQAPASDDHG